MNTPPLRSELPRLNNSRHGALCVIGLAMLCALPGVFASAAGSNVEQRIQRIQSSLLPPVLVKGEPIPLNRLSTRMAALHVPGVSIAVIHGGKLEWARGFGVVRIGGPPVTPETLFQAASISKVVSALAVLNLAQARKLDLDTDVNQYLKTWQLPPSELTRQAKVTLRGLLTHSAGITVHGFAGYVAGEPLPSTEQILSGEPPANNPPIRVDMVPGLTWRYSGGGYTIAQQVLTDVTGIAFPALMQELVLRPLGMKRSSYEQPPSKDLLSRAAMPYRVDGTPVPGGPQVYPELAAAGLWTTAADLARYAIGVQRAFMGKSERVLSEASAHAMLTPVYNKQALGLVIGGSAAHKYFNHGGANAGYRCYLRAYESGDGAVIMTNSDSGDQLTGEILRTIAHEYGWADGAPAERTLAAIDPQSFDQYVGAYRLPSGDIATFWRDGSHLKSRIWGQAAVEMYPTSAREYFLKAVDARWVFATDANGIVPAVTLYQDDQEQLAKKLDDAEGPPALETSIALEKRIKEQAAAPGSEAALRRLIAGLGSGKPNYDEMVPGLAQITRQQLDGLQKSIVRLGPIRSVSFNGVGPAGWDIYAVKFERDTREFRILLDPDGHIRAAQFSP